MSNSKQPSICLIIPYFGNFPAYFDFFISSCIYNPSIDWLIITDNQYKSPAPNIKVINQNFNDFKNFVQTKFDFDISLETPYKLCDFRPAYGYIFEDLISEYDFWGHCDMDLVFGQIRKFITNNILQLYDKILICGHLSLYRNTYEINRWFKTLSPIAPRYTYDKIFKSNKSYAFDEFGGKSSWGGMVDMIKKSGISIFDEMDFDDIRQTQYSFYSRRLIENFPYSLAELSKMPSYYSFEKGKLMRHIKTPKGENISESLYVHFQKRNMRVASGITDLSDFVIVPNVFVPNTYTKSELWYMARYRRFYFPYYKRRFKNLQKKIKNLFE